MRRLVPLLAAASLASCGFWKLKPGPTDDGLALTVPGAAGADARRKAVDAVLSLYLSVPQRTAEAARLEEKVLSRPAAFTGRERAVEGGTVVEVRLDPLAALLEKESLVRPAGFPKGQPRALILLAEGERVLNLGVGPASDALRRALLARGLSAADGGDALLAKPGRAAPSTEEASRQALAAGVDYVLVGHAVSAAAPDTENAAWRGSAQVQAELRTKDGPLDAVEGAGAALDVSSAAARGRALEQAGEAAAERAAAAIAAARAGREEVLIQVSGLGGPARLQSLIASIRRVKGVAAAALVTHRDDDGAALVRAFCAGLKADELAARLLRLDPDMQVLGVEPELGRVLVELGGAE